MLVAVIDINIVVTTGADLNHLVLNIFKSNVIIFIRLQMNQPEMHRRVEIMQEDSKEPRFSKQ